MKYCGLLRSLLLQDLFYTEVPAERGDFKKWVASGQYIVRDIPTPTTIKVEVNNDYAFNHMLAYDSCRMAAAAMETMLNINSADTLPKSIGWLAIKSYYAAFFSAHSIMRCFGFLCSQLEKGHVKQINSFGQAVGLTGLVKPESGFFSGSYLPESRVLSLKKMKNTHEDTWQTLVECLTKVSADVLSVAGLSSQKQSLSAEIDNLIFRLKDRDRLVKGNYLSQYRNAVNYRQEHGAWHPYGKSSVKSEKVVSLLSSWMGEDSFDAPVWKESMDSYNFFSTCRDVVNLNYQIINLVIGSSDKENLYKRWPGRLINTASAA